MTKIPSLKNQDKLDANDIRISTLLTQNETLTKQVEELQGKLAESQRELNDAITKNTELKSALDESQSKVTKNDGTINELRAKNEGLNGRNKTLNNELLELKAKMESLRQGARQAIIKAREDADQSVKTITEELQEAQAKLQEKITAKEAELANNKERLAENDSRISALLTENETLTYRVTELQGQLQASEKANQALKKELTAEKERAELAEMALEDFKTTALQTQAALNTELDEKTAQLTQLQGELAKFQEEQQEIDQVLQPGVVNVARQSSGPGRVEVKPQSIPDKIKALQSEIAGLREANSFLTAASEKAELKAQAKLDKQDRQTQLATAIIAEITAFDSSQFDTKAFDVLGAAEGSIDISGYTTREDLSSRGSDGLNSEGSIENQMVMYLSNQFRRNDLQAQGILLGELSNISNITSPANSVEGGSTDSSPYSSGDEQEQEEVTHPLDQFLSDQVLNGTKLAGSIKSLFDSKVAEISSIKFEQDIQEILQLRLRQLEITGGQPVKKVFPDGSQLNKAEELYENLGTKIQTIYKNYPEDKHKILKARVKVLYQPYEDLALARTNSSLLTQDIQSKQTEIEGLKRTEEKLRQGKKTNKEQINSAEKRLKASSNEIQRKSEELATAQQELETLKSENKRQRAKSNKKVKELKESVKSLETQIAGDTEIYNSVLQERNEFVEKFKAAEGKEAELTRQLEALKQAEDQEAGLRKKSLKNLDQEQEN